MAKEAKKKKVEKKSEPKKLGCPTKFRPEFCDQAYKLCLLGATDKELADFFGVTEQTINGWKKKHPSFFESIIAGKEKADAKVAESLYKKAVGYEHDAVKIFMPAGADSPVYAPYIERYAPDTQAASLWLRNRQPSKWRDKQDIEHSGTIGIERIERVIVDPDEDG